MRRRTRLDRRARRLRARRRLVPRRRELSTPRRHLAPRRRVLVLPADDAFGDEDGIDDARHVLRDVSVFGIRRRQPRVEDALRGLVGVELKGVS